ncbi:SprB repeat-containing protein [Zobellia nedashkovskayae]
MTKLQSPDNTHSFNVNARDYIIEVSTADGCAYSEDVTVTRTPDPTITALTTRNIGCTAGTITLTGAGGLPNPDYSYAIWSKNGTNLYADVASIPGDAYDTDPIFTFGWRDTDADDVDEYFAGEDGDYVFVIVDSNNCFAFSNEVTINDNGAMTLDSIDETAPSCSGDSDGAITINTTGGVAPYQFSIDGGTTTQGTPNFVNLIAGTYEVFVTDSSGCTFSETVDLTEPFPLSASAGVSRDATC